MLPTELDVVSNAQSILQNIVNNSTQFVVWTLNLVVKALFTILQPVALVVVVVGVLLWFTGLERRAGKRLVIGGLIIWLISLIY
ncbi:hypothetical protein B9Q03_08635 [Candidatus Marsarchaeota G2 archaeon OSP_D]|jgi:hypothetical protein|uniref:Uncharacterized protein n=6 Tax=Candidatus Marsarchaeota group 2 TaxID=2203771 RepID=A0A2R6CBP0_9ARCH|nr:MAG: hypothetical protein B9Q03_08635 [Candidatus Marsarchaeota G2 archaeon OSP_D]PSN91649.1 MAG: hypothetical protein B9Q08_02475 [Candidatus Marsarchaeota G2 archaeon ECH_B_SAG-M15]PSN95947.1 MAG: hypothetical protein B9Q06_03800 [Candidatus Marsarchaeota G2 archaeon ECH_B_2]PSO00723.1 MAG: hypothetical protein B9Q07_02630 [Candidatus Marsarchaeota G2 archaeon ECH_B_3]PSO02551.1 MAG: hypothetical protein B9Q05_04700 [Candidatus Marsarchaeota G2 archaeon ECH_B_1]PSO08176.1 MAG: hypothetica